MERERLLGFQPADDGQPNAESDVSFRCVRSRYETVKIARVATALASFWLLLRNKTMAKLGSVTTQVGSLQKTAPHIPTDEKVGGILFDISGFDNPFADYLQLDENFGSQQIRLINNMDDAEYIGIKDNGFLGGLVYYHILAFYNYIGTDAPLFIAFADCSSNWDFISTMQRQCGGKMFQLGIWTHQNLWEIDGSTGLIAFSSLVVDIENATEELTGKVGLPSPSPTPLSVILSPNTNIGEFRNFSLKKLPDGFSLDAPKVSVLLYQNGTDAVHNMQNNMPDNAPVGSIGLTMALLCLAGAEESIGNVKDYNLNKNDNYEEPEVVANGMYYKTSELSKNVLNIVTSLGYIVPVNYAAKEGECFLNGDMTFSNGDYCTIANNRVIHKCRRAIFSVLLPYLHSNQLYDSSRKGLAASVIQTFYEEIGAALSGKLINKTGNYQINGYQIDTFDTENILEDDSVTIQYTVGPVNYNGTLTDSVTAQ